MIASLSIEQLQFLYYHSFSITTVSLEHQKSKCLAMVGVVVRGLGAQNSSYLHSTQWCNKTKPFQSLQLNEI